MTGFSGTQSSTITGKNNGLLIPLYIYPTGGAAESHYANLISLARKYHSVPITVIVNPSNGPGTLTDGNYTDAILELQGAGIRVLGYVDTDYPYLVGHNTVSVSQAETLIDTWLNLYPTINGIFFDDMNNPNPITIDIVNYYKRLLNYCHARGLFDICNPGAQVVDDYYTNNLADVIVINETSGFPAENTLNQYTYNTQHPYTSRGILVYGSGVWSQANFQMIMKYAGLIFCNSDPSAVLPSPWDVLTTNLETQLELIAQSSLPIAQNAGGSSAPYYVEMVDYASSGASMVTPTATGTWLFECLGYNQTTSIGNIGVVAGSASPVGTTSQVNTRIKWTKQLT
jgi:hypothetical protein